MVHLVIRCLFVKWVAADREARPVWLVRKRQAIFCCEFISNEEEGKVCRRHAVRRHLHAGWSFISGGEPQPRGRPLLYDVVDCRCRGENDLDSVVLVTGGYDGKIKLFSYDMELKLEFDARGKYDCGWLRVERVSQL